VGTKILTFSIHCLENESKKIHDSWERLNQLVRLVAGRSKLEKQQIRENYKAMYGEEMTILFQKMQAQMGSKERAAL
jgi:annexin A7/11/annexin A13